MRKIKDENITLAASKKMMNFQNNAPEKITDLVIKYVDTFCYVNTTFKSAGVDVDENIVLELTKEIMNKYYQEK